jgi:hypothetical protein
MITIDDTVLSIIITYDIKFAAVKMEKSKPFKRRGQERLFNDFTHGMKSHKALS